MDRLIACVLQLAKFSPETATSDVVVEHSAHAAFEPDEQMLKHHGTLS